MKCCEKISLPKVDKDVLVNIITVAAAVAAVAAAAAALFNLLVQVLGAMKEIRRTMPVVRRAAQIYVDERTPEPEDDDLDFDPDEILADIDEDDEPAVLEEEMIRSMQEELDAAKYL